MRGPVGSVSEAEQGSDALDRRQILVMTDRPDGAAVSERLMHREIEPFGDGLESRPVERATALQCSGTAARRTTPRPSVRVLLEEQHLDTRI